MFLKPYKVKSNSPLKGSDTKRLRQRLEKSFPHVSPEVLLTLFPARANVSVLKLLTHAEFQTNVFCVEKLPMFFEIENNILVPTLYALWQVPNLLPYFTTLSAVLKNLNNGADLMLPGVLPQGTGMNIYGRYKKDQLVGVNLSNNKSAVGVGILLRSSDDLYMSGGKGQAVKMLHIFGDKLWGHEPGLTQQIPQQQEIALQADDFPEIGANAKKSNSNNAPTTFASIAVEHPNGELHEVMEDLIINNVDNEQSPIENESTEESISAEETLKHAFLAAIKNHGKTLTLPLLTSNFYRLYVVPEAPQNFDLKRTRYKKLSNFLKEMVDEGFLVVREETKGVDKITSIDTQHPEVVNFITDVKSNSQTDVDGNKPQQLFHSSLVDVYVVTDETAKFFTRMDFKRGEAIPEKRLSHIIREYVSKYGLKQADKQSNALLLDPTLEELCERKEATIQQIYGAVAQKMTRTYKMCSGQNTTNNKPAIQMQISTRSGNKKVTLVSNIESYGIIMPEFIKMCKQGAAASATMVKLPSQKNEQLQLQGNQIRFVYNLLTETYKVPPKSILGMQFAEKLKKKK